uniref:Uncharacterized protein n=1 Tax=Physcomitrium patens TaxID=3218 RepID=A0A2K1KD54_PHYPA|nr:hypothetical protein PHYPA_010867 [Physcomitrium patens]
MVEVGHICVSKHACKSEPRLAPSQNPVRVFVSCEGITNLHKTQLLSLQVEIQAQRSHQLSNTGSLQELLHAIPHPLIPNLLRRSITMRSRLMANGVAGTKISPRAYKICDLVERHRQRYIPSQRDISRSLVQLNYPTSDFSLAFEHFAQTRCLIGSPAPTSTLAL